jgi:hypothetical protein
MWVFWAPLATTREPLCASSFLSPQLLWVGTFAVYACVLPICGGLLNRIRGGWRPDPTMEFPTWGDTVITHVRERLSCRHCGSPQHVPLTPC